MIVMVGSKDLKPAKTRGRVHLPVDAEARALMASPVFRAMLDEAKASVAVGATISLEELDRRRPLTEEDKAIGDEYLAVFDCLEAEQDAEVTDDQARLFKAILIAARYLQNGRTLAEWTEYTGIPEAEIRAAAMALRVAGLVSAPAAAQRR